MALDGVGWILLFLTIRIFMVILLGEVEREGSDIKIFIKVLMRL